MVPLLLRLDTLHPNEPNSLQILESHAACFLQLYHVAEKEDCLVYYSDKLKQAERLKSRERRPQVDRLDGR